MRRITTATAQANKHGTGKNGFRDGVGAATLAPTRLNAEWHDTVQEEIATVIEGCGDTLDATGLVHAQMFGSIRKLVATFPVIASVQVRDTDSSHTADVLRDICFAPDGGPTADGLYVAVGVELTGAVPGGRVWSSYDGITWSKVSSGLAVHHNAVAYGAGLLVVVGHNASLDPVIAVATGTGGTFVNVDITSLTVGTESNPLYGVCHDATNNRFIAVGARSTPGLALMYSNSIATAWTLATPASGYLGEFERVMRASSGRVFAIGTLGVVQSTDDGGVTWTQRFSDATLGDLSTIAEIDGVLLVSTAQALTILRSADNGVTWTEVGPDDVPLEPALIDPKPELVGSFEGLAFAVMKDNLTERRRIVVSLDRGLTWPWVVRAPSDGGASPTFAYAASATDGSRLVLVGGTVSLTTAVALCSSVASVIDL